MAQTRLIIVDDDSIPTPAADLLGGGLAPDHAHGFPAEPLRQFDQVLPDRRVARRLADPSVGHRRIAAPYRCPATTSSSNNQRACAIRLSVFGPQRTPVPRSAGGQFPQLTT